MRIYKEMDFDDLYENSWGGAKDTMAKVESAGKQEELMDILQEIYCGITPSETQVNDLLWFDDEYLFDLMGIKEDEDE